jgi:hypothetical protein
LGSFSKIAVAAQISGLLFSSEKSYTLILSNKCVWLHFGRINRKLIWSPCPHQSLNDEKCRKDFCLLGWAAALDCFQTIREDSLPRSFEEHSRFCNPSFIHLLSYQIMASTPAALHSLRGGQSN